MANGANWQEDLERRLQRLCDKDGQVPRDVAVELIEDSAWWLTHVHGPVRAPKHAQRISGGPRSWSLEFGANTFEISTAVRRCCDAVRTWASSQKGAVSAGSWGSIRSQLVSVVRGCVSNYRGDEYYSYGSGDEMVFGAQAINVSDFLKTLGRLLNLTELDVYQRTLQKGSQADRTPKGPMTQCPWCASPVLVARLSKHQAERCAKRPTAVPPAG
jgi:hypothetical protein